MGVNELFKTSNKFLEFQSELATENYREIIKALRAKRFPQEIKFSAISDESLNNYILELMLEILGGEYEVPIFKFLRNTTYTEREDELFAKSIDTIIKSDDTSYVDSTKFELSSARSSLTVPLAARQYTAALLSSVTHQREVDFYGNVHYYLVPRIVMEKIVAKEFSLVMQADLWTNLQTLRQKEQLPLLEAVAKLERAQASAANKAAHISFMHTLGDVYGNYLFRLYLEEPTHFLNLFRRLIKGGINLQEYFKIYGVSLENPQVVDSYLELLKR